MGILDRLTRMIRAEYSEAKRVMKDRDDDPETMRRRKEEELERARRDLERAERELVQAREAEAQYQAEGGAEAWAKNKKKSPGDENDGASQWKRGSGGPRTTSDGASAWARPDGGGGSDNKAGTEGVYSGSLYPRPIREAYAALELPMGSGREAIQAAHRELVSRYHPDKHQGDEQRLATANELTRRINEARGELLSWLDKRGL